MDTAFIFAAKYLYLLAALAFVAVFFALPRERRGEMIRLAVVALPLIYILARIGAAIWYDPRPFVVTGIAPLIPHAADNGFPSDHMLLVSALAMVAWYFDRKSSWTIWAIAAVVGFSRVYVGVHHVADILGSVVFAIVGACIARWAVGRFWKKRLPVPAQSEPLG